MKFFWGDEKIEIKLWDKLLSRERPGTSLLPSTILSSRSLPLSLLFVVDTHCTLQFNLIYFKRNYQTAPSPTRSINAIKAIKPTPTILITREKESQQRKMAISTISFFLFFAFGSKLEMI